MVKKRDLKKGCENKIIPTFKSCINNNNPLVNDLDLGKSDFSYDTKKSYSARDFTDDLLNELNNHPEEMFKLNPNRILRKHSGCTLQDISRLWGHYDGYISEKLNYHRNNLSYVLPDKTLLELELNLKNDFGNKADLCIDLLNLHKNGLISFESFINKLQIEVGRISNCVTTTLNELALVFNYVYGMISYIRNNDYTLSRERLLLVKNNLKTILGNNSKNALKIVEKYEELNPNLLDYANQKYTIENPRFFSNIYCKGNETYWFGWLCADGWVSQFDNGHYQIQLKLKREDRVILERFATTVGYNHDRIYDESYLFKDENSALKINYSSRVIFGCKPMWQDLVKLGIFEFKNHGQVPHIITDLIKSAKVKKPYGQLIETKEGSLALRFLLGFYDGDGNLHSRMSARILNSKKEFLIGIKDLFDIPNNVGKNNEKLIDTKTDKVLWKPRYFLYLGTEIFRQMLLSYENSLQRKRPEGYKTDITELKDDLHLVL